MSFTDYVVGLQMFHTMTADVEVRVGWTEPCLSLQGNADFRVYLNGKFVARSHRGHVNFRQVYEDGLSEHYTSGVIPKTAMIGDALWLRHFDVAVSAVQDTEFLQIVGVFAVPMLVVNPGLGVSFGGAVPKIPSDLDAMAYTSDPEEGLVPNFETKSCLPVIQHLALALGPRA